MDSGDENVMLYAGNAFSWAYNVFIGMVVPGLTLVRTDWGSSWQLCILLVYFCSLQYVVTSNRSSTQIYVYFGKMLSPPV